MSEPIRVGGGFWTCAGCGEVFHASDGHTPHGQECRATLTYVGRAGVPAPAPQRGEPGERLQQYVAQMRGYVEQEGDTMTIKTAWLAKLADAIDAALSAPAPGAPRVGTGRKTDDDHCTECGTSLYRCGAFVAANGEQCLLGSDHRGAHLFAHASTAAEATVKTVCRDCGTEVTAPFPPCPKCEGVMGRTLPEIPDPESAIAAGVEPWEAYRDAFRALNALLSAGAAPGEEK